MAYAFRPGPPIPLPELTVQVRKECEYVLAACGLFYRMKQTITRNQITECLTRRKTEILNKFPAGNKADAEEIIDNFSWDVPHMSLGGKRKRRTMHRKRSHKKNSSRRNRRVRQ